MVTVDMLHLEGSHLMVVQLGTEMVFPGDYPEKEALGCSQGMVVHNPLLEPEVAGRAVTVVTLVIIIRMIIISTILLLTLLIRSSIILEIRQAQNLAETGNRCFCWCHNEEDECQCSLQGAFQCGPRM